MYTLERDVAARLARQAGAAALAHYGTARADPGTSASPVTAADRAANEVIVNGLKREFPGDAILSEESSDSAARLGAARVWIVDPLDGTKEFLAQNGEFAVMIGIAVDGNPVAGAVYLPAMDVLYAAALGSGAYVERDGGRARLNRDEADCSALRLVGSRSHAEPLVVALAGSLGISDVAPCGSVGVKCARIADGLRDLYVHPVPFLKEWDTCAPEIVMREAGCHVSDCLGAPLTYNKSNPRQPEGLLVCAPGCSDIVLSHLRPLYSKRVG